VLDFLYQQGIIEKYLFKKNNFITLFLRIISIYSHEGGYMRILVTGGAGFVGSHTVLQLKDQGHFIVVYDNLSKGHKQLLFGDEFVQGDIHDKKLLSKTMKKFNIEAVLHFAAFIEAGESMKLPVKYFNNNSVGSLVLLDAMIENKINFFVFSSTAALYGYPDMIPIKENSALVPVNAYGESKLLVEKVLHWYSEIYGLRYVSLRYFNAAGSDLQLRTGEMHNPETHLIPLALQTAYGERESLFIFGTDYNTKDGTCVRDYIHVTDLATAHLLALNYLSEGNKSNIFNLGSETGYTVKEVIETVKKHTNIDFKVIETERRPGDPETLIASSEKIRSTLGWQPQFSDIDTIVDSAMKFYKKWKI